MRILLDLASQPADMHLKRACIANIVSLPHLLHEKLVAKDLTLMAHKGGQQLALFWRQANDAMAILQLSRPQVQAQVIHGEDLSSLLPPIAHYAPPNAHPLTLLYHRSPDRKANQPV